jgi:hypothetical protein
MTNIRGKLGEKPDARCPEIELGLRGKMPASNQPRYGTKCLVYAENKLLGVINIRFNQIPSIYTPVDVHAFFFFSCCSHLEDRESVEPFVSL